MLTLSSAAIIEKNKLVADGAWFVLLEINLKTPATTLHLVRNSDDITWDNGQPTWEGGHVWTAFPFDLGDVVEDSKGSLPNLTLTVSNVTRTMQYYLEQGNGAVGATVTLYVVHSKHLDLTSPELMETFEVISAKADAVNVTFELGAGYPLMTRRPEKRIMKNFCPFVYGDIECSVDPDVLANPATLTCGKTLTDCRIRNNSSRFGGEVSIPTGGALFL